jgi:hypothetical protein
MQQRSVVFSASRGFDRNLGSILQAQNAGITGLATADRVEHSAIEHDAIVANSHDAGVALPEIHVFVIE